MKKILLIITLFIALPNIYGQVTPKKSKKVFIDDFLGYYACYEWSDDLINVLKNSKYTADEIAVIKKNTASENRPSAMTTNELFQANSKHMNNYIGYEITSFKHVYLPNEKEVKYFLIWIPFAENQNLPSGIRPENKEGFYFILHRYNVQSKSKPINDLSILTQRDLDAEKARIEAEIEREKNQKWIEEERLSKTYTVTYILQKTETSFGSVRVFYSAVFVEVYDVYNSRSQEKILSRAKQELSNVQMNGYSIYKTSVDNITAKEARSIVTNSIELSDFRTYQVELK